MSADPYAKLSSEEYADRLRSKLENMEVEWLATALLHYAYDEMVEEFNNEILDDWRQEQENI